MSIQPEREFVPEWTDGDKLRKVRRHLGLTQAEFATALQVHPQTYGAWESDRNRIKDIKSIARRIKAMSGTPLWWWFDTEQPNQPGPGGGGVFTGSGSTAGKSSCSSKQVSSIIPFPVDAAA